MKKPTRVLIVDDSALMRHRLGVIVGATPGYEVAGFARNGKECVAQLSTLRPDVITLDVEMPGMDGLATLDQIMKERPTPVVMVSSLTEAGATITMDALARGAVDYLAKPSAVSTDPANSFNVELMHKVACAATVRVTHLLRHAARQTLPAAPARPRPAPPSPMPQGRRGATPLVLIGSSTGGPQALDTVFGALVDPLPAAVLVVQHMPPVFTSSLAARLDRRSAVQVREAVEGDAPALGEALVAPGGWHMTLGTDGRVHLDQEPPIHGVRPAVDRTLHSLAMYWRGPLLAVILTGMGTDGADGAVAIRAQGATVYAQDEETSIVYGMPRAVVQRGAASAVLPLDGMPRAIVEWAHTHACTSTQAVTSASRLTGVGA